MSESDRQLRDALSGAFDKVHAPEQLKMRTIEMIEAQRMRQTDGVVEDALKLLIIMQKSKSIDKHLIFTSAN